MALYYLWHCIICGTVLSVALYYYANKDIFLSKKQLSSRRAAREAKMKAEAEEAEKKRKEEEEKSKALLVCLKLSIFNRRIVK